MAGSLLPEPKQQFLNDIGVPLFGGQIFTYAAGTLTPKATYQDQALTIANTNPVVANARGEVIMYGSGNYRIILKDSFGNTIYDRDNIETNDGIANSILNSLALTSGANLVGFDYASVYASNTLGWGVQTCGTSFNLWRLIPPSEWAEIANGTSTFDVATLLNTAISTRKDVFVPPGKYSLYSKVKFIPSMRLRGGGQNQTIFVPVGLGGTQAELAAYNNGSIFGRDFTLGVANSRIDTVHLSDFAVVMDHPTSSVTTTKIQIAIDMRNVGRFEVERVWAGNIAPLGGLMVKADPAAYASQGYSFVAGNVDTGNVSYCGGEVGNVKSCSFYGAYKTFVQDDTVLSPLSGAHSIKVVGCDIQGAHHLLVQEQQYTAGCFYEANTVQDIRRQPGNASPTYVMRIAGYDNYIGPQYIEAGVADYLLRFDSASSNNKVVMTHYSATTIGIAAFSDAGRRNRVECSVDSGSLAGGVDSKGQQIVRLDRSYEFASINGHWDGTNMIVEGGFGISVTRPTTAGDYVFTFALPFVDGTRYTPTVVSDTNASGHGGTYSVISHGSSNIRIQFYAQNGASSTTIDPRWFAVSIRQN